MSNVLIALFIAAGIAGLAYTKLGKRAGYGNEKNVWTLVLMSFAISFLVVIILLKTLVTL